MSELSTRVRLRREELGLSQEQLAQFLKVLLQKKQWSFCRFEG